MSAGHVYKKSANRPYLLLMLSEDRTTGRVRCSVTKIVHIGSSFFELYKTKQATVFWKHGVDLFKVYITW